MKDKTAYITSITGEQDFKIFLLSHGVLVNTKFHFNYSPHFSKLVSITINNRILSFREKEFRQIKWEWEK